MPVAYFLVCLTLKDDTEENRRTVAAYLDPVREQGPQVQPEGLVGRVCQKSTKKPGVFH